MKNKKWTTILCVLALGFSLLAAAFGWGYVSGSALLSFGLRWAAGFAFTMPPLLLVLLLIQIRRKSIDS